MTTPSVAGLAPDTLEQLLTPTILLVMVNEAGAILDVRHADSTFLLAQLAAQAQASRQSTTGDSTCNNSKKAAAGRFPWLSG